MDLSEFRKHESHREALNNDGDLDKAAVRLQESNRDDYFLKLEALLAYSGGLLTTGIWGLAFIHFLNRQWVDLRRVSHSFPEGKFSHLLEFICAHALNNFHSFSTSLKVFEYNGSCYCFGVSSVILGLLAAGHIWVSSFRTKSAHKFPIPRIVLAAASYLAVNLDLATLIMGSSGLFWGGINMKLPGFIEPQLEILGFMVQWKYLQQQQQRSISLLGGDGGYYERLAESFIKNGVPSRWMSWSAIWRFRYSWTQSWFRAATNILYEIIFLFTDRQTGWIAAWALAALCIDCLIWAVRVKYYYKGWLKIKSRLWNKRDLVYSILKFLPTIIFAIAVTLTILIGQLFVSSLPSGTASDHHWDVARGSSSTTFKSSLDALGSDWKSTFQMPHFTKNFVLTKSLRMTDGVLIALDIYLGHSYINSALENSTTGFLPAPTFVQFTRYNRRTSIRWPATANRFWNFPAGGGDVSNFNWPIIHHLTQSGYVVILVDARGTGGSTGHRLVDLGQAEVDDYLQVLAWIQDQEWYDGTVATGGVSYDGMAGMYLAGHPKSRGVVKAVVALYTPIAAAEDLFQPSGLAGTAFIDDYGGMTRHFERLGNPKRHFLFNAGFSQLPWHIIFGYWLFFRGPTWVKGTEELMESRHQKETRKLNWNMRDAATTTMFADQVLEVLNGQKIIIGSSGIPPAVTAGVAENNVSVYMVAGTCDGNNLRSAVRTFGQLLRDTPHGNLHQHRLIVGPWGHTGRRLCGTAQAKDRECGSWPHFEKHMYVDIIRHLDCLLKKDCDEAYRRSLQDEPIKVWRSQSSRLEGSKWIAFKRIAPPHYLRLKLTSTPILRSGFARSPLLGRSIKHDLSQFWHRRDAVGLAYSTSEAITIILSGIKRHWHFTYQQGKLLMNFLVFNAISVDEGRLIIVGKNRYVSGQNLESSDFEMIAPSEKKAAEKVLPAIVGRQNLSFIHHAPLFNVSPVGALSRWSIVQHHVRLPLNAEVSMEQLRYAQQFRTRFASIINAAFSKQPSRVQRRFWPKSAALTFTTSELVSVVHIMGSPALHIPIIVREPKGSLWDLPVFAVIEEVTTSTTTDSVYVTEGRTLQSHSTYINPKFLINSNQPFNRPLSLIEAFLTHPSNLIELDHTMDEDIFLQTQASTDWGLPSSSHHGRSANNTSSIMFENEDRISHLLIVRIRFDHCVHSFKKGSRIRLSLFADDNSNFEWAATSSKIAHALSLTCCNESQSGLSPQSKSGTEIIRPREWVIPVLPSDQGSASLISYPGELLLPEYE